MDGRVTDCFIPQNLIILLIFGEDYKYEQASHISTGQYQFINLSWFVVYP